MSGGITEPVSRALQQVLRRAVLEHARSEQRRVYPPVVNVGVPGRRSRTFEVTPDDRLDHALRTDIVETMVRHDLDRGVVPLIWLTRRELSETHHGDQSWVAAAGAAGGELGVSLALVVVTRRSWHDPVSGVSRTWKRVRDRSG